MEYRLTGAQNPASRIDRVTVESPSEDFPEGKVLELGGNPVELSDEQVSILSNHVRLEPIKATGDVVPQIVDQPGVAQPSQSTDVPPDPGTAPDISAMNKDQLAATLGRVRSQDPTALPDLTDRSSKEDLRQGLGSYYGQEV